MVKWLDYSGRTTSSNLGEINRRSVLKSKAQKPNRYPAEFKESAVQLAIESCDPIAKTAQSLDINVNTLHNWIGKYRKPQKPKASPATLEHVYDELKQMKEERDILT